MSHRAHPSVLVIAGHDPSGGAGITLDCMVLHAMGISVTSAVTTVTIQDSTSLVSSAPVDSEVLNGQLRAVINDARPDTIKVGALCDREQIDVVKRIIQEEGLRAIVDPILGPTNGAPLASIGRSELAQSLMGLVSGAEGATPNIDEALTLLGVEPGAGLTAVEAGQRLLAATGETADWMIVTGGHQGLASATDTLVTKDQDIELSSPMLDFAIRGTGCLFSSCIAGRLALGDEIDQAFGNCKALVAKAIAGAEQVGRGSRQVTPGALRAAL